jgi:hypothetical protein
MHLQLYVLVGVTPYLFGLGCCEKAECKECSDVCFQIYQPLCGTDGVTYGNECMLNYATCMSGGVVGAAHEGACKTSGFHSDSLKSLSSCVSFFVTSTCASRVHPLTHCCLFVAPFRTYRSPNRRTRPADRALSRH